MKELALALIKGASILFPPLAELIASALDKLDPNDPRQPLADEVRAVLPERSETRKALDELEAGKSNEP